MNTEQIEADDSTRRTKKETDSRKRTSVVPCFDREVKKSRVPFPDQREEKIDETKCTLPLQNYVHNVILILIRKVLLPANISKQLV